MHISYDHLAGHAGLESSERGWKLRKRSRVGWLFLRRESLYFVLAVGNERRFQETMS